MKRSLFFSYSGHSFVDWATQLDEFERGITRGDGFRLSLDEINLDNEFLRKLRCLNLAEYEIAERPAKAFRDEVVVPLLLPEEQRRYLTTEQLLPFLKREWNLSENEIEAESDSFVSLRWMMGKQTGQTLNARLHQAFDFVTLFYDVYTLECPDEILKSSQPISSQFKGIFSRYDAESNAWFQTLMGYVLYDLLAGTAFIDESIKTDIDRVFTNHSHLHSKWKGRAGYT